MIIDLQFIFTVLILLIIVLIILAIFILHQLSKQKNGSDEKSLKLLNDSLSHLWANLDRKLNESQKMMGDNMSKTFDTSSRINQEANKAIENITKKMTQLEETNSQIKDIWGQLKGLENILKNPKRRWNLWEYFLWELLENVFTPQQYTLQYNIWEVWIADAVLFIGDKIIPIDAKFPQENYEKLIYAEDEYSINKFWNELKKDIKKRIDETSKYIVPEKNTTDFAFMLIPAEWLYYDIFIAKVGWIQSKELIEYAFSKKVIIASPSSFYAYLQTVMQGMKALQIETQAKEIQKYVVKLQKDLEKYEELFLKIWNSLWATVNHYNAANKRLEIIDTDIFKLTRWEAGGNAYFDELKKPE